MQGFESADETERSLAEALGELQPAPLDVPAEQIWYRAGVAAGRRQVRTWRAVAAVAAILAAVSLRFPQAPPTTVERPREAYVAVTPVAPVVYPVPTEAVDSTASSSYLALRNGLLERGLDALPAEMPQPAVISDDPKQRNLDRFFPRRLGEHFGERG